MSLDNSPEYIQSSTNKHESAWRLVRAVAIADNAGPVVSPYTLATFNTAWKYEIGYTIDYTGTPSGSPDLSTMGRTLMSTHGGDIIEFLGIFTNSGVTCAIQPWAFDWQRPPGLGHDEPVANAALREALPKPSFGDTRNFALNVPYNLAQDVAPGTQTITLTARADRYGFNFISSQTLPSPAGTAGFGASVIPVISPSGGGDLYYVSDRRRVQMYGLPAMSLIITNITGGAGSLAGILARYV